MKKYLPLVLIFFLSSSFHTEREWTSLLDKNLSQWETYLSYRLKPGYTGEVPLDDQGKPLPPVGYNKNEAQVFTVNEENGDPVLRISGEIYGCVFTREDFTNYQLRLKMKWGTLKWDPRKNEPMDSGILYNSQGECGVDYWHAWMLSQEFQIMEHSLGDYWSIANSQIDVKAIRSGNQGFKYDPAGTLVSLGSGTGNAGYCQGSGDFEKPRGEWNDIELINFEGNSVYIINGHVVNALSRSRYDDHGVSKPLTHGKIQLQSEAAEVYYKDIEIRPIDKMPSELAGLFK